MAKISLSVAELFGTTFGYNSPALSDGVKDVSVVGRDYATLKELEPTTPRGAPYWAKDVFGRDYYMPVKLGGMDLPYPVVSLRTRTRVIETPLTEREGEVNEMVSIEGYQVTIRGIIVDPGGVFPYNQVKQLSDLFRRGKGEALEIVNPITEIHLPYGSDGRQRVITLDYDFPETRGVMGVRGYMLVLKSDIDFNLEEIG